MESRCANCNVLINQNTKQKAKKFCSDRCRFTYWNAKRGLIRKEESIAICANCGREFDDQGKNGREYCSYSCNITARHGTKPIGRRAEALRLHAEGYSTSYISRLQGSSKNTVKSWIHRYSDHQAQIETADNESDMEIAIEPDFGDVEIYTLKEAHIRKVFLVCGPLLFRGKIDAFAARIPQALEYNLGIGDVFVFCSRARCQLSALQWQGHGFTLMFRRTEKSRYPWPNFDVIRIVEITESDLQALVDYPNFLMRLSGDPTPLSSE